MKTQGFAFRNATYGMSRSHVRTLADLEALSAAAADALLALVTNVLDKQERFTLALAGGSTPRRLYQLLAGAYRDRLPWHRLHLFWGDERFVPPEHPESNFGMVRNALLQHVPLPPGQIHPFPTDTPSPEAAADAYEATLRDLLGTSGQTFDLTLLGLGSDGHTASLFPENEPYPPDSARWAAAVTAPPSYAVQSRLTLTLPALNASRHIFFLVAGREKREALHAVLDGTDSSLPAAHVRAGDTLTWFVDEAALGKR